MNHVSITIAITHHHHHLMKEMQIKKENSLTLS